MSAIDEPEIIVPAPNGSVVSFVEAKWIGELTRLRSELAQAQARIAKMTQDHYWSAEPLPCGHDVQHWTIVPEFSGTEIVGIDSEFCMACRAEADERDLDALKTSCTDGDHSCYCNIDFSDYEGLSQMREPIRCEHRGMLVRMDERREPVCAICEIERLVAENDRLREINRGMVDDLSALRARIDRAFHEYMVVTGGPEGDEQTEYRDRVLAALLPGGKE